MVGSEDGSIIFKFPATANFPIYGAIMKVTVPNWYTGYEPESTFHSGITCDAPTGAEFYEDDEDGCGDSAFFTPNPDSQLPSVYTYLFSRWTTTSEITFKCYNFRNPIYN